MALLFFRNHNEKSMLRQSRALIIGVLAVSVLLIAVLWLVQEINDYKNRADRIRGQFIHVEGQFARQQVHLALDYIESRQTNARDQLKIQLMNEAEKAVGVAEEIFENSRLDRQQKRLVILQAIDGMNDINGNFQVVNNDGDAVIQRNDSSSYINVRSAQWKNILKQGRGYLSTYPKTDNKNEVLNYVIEFQPYNWYIIKSVHYSDFNRSLQQEVLNYLSTLRFGHDGYIFITTMEGKLLIENGDTPLEPRSMKNYRDPDGKNIFHLLKNAGTKPEGGYVYYKWKKLYSDTVAKKMTYVNSFDDWGWLIGSGIYMDDLQEFMQVHKASQYKKIRNTIIKIVLLVILVIMISFWLLNRFSKRVKRDYARLSRFLEQASKDNIEIDPEEFSYREMKELAGVSNRMVRSRVKTAEDLKMEKLYLERLLESAPEGVVVTDKEGYVLRVNNKFLSIFNYRPEETIGKHIDDLIAPDELKREAGRYTLVVGQGKDLSRETIRQTSDGRRLYVSILATPITTKGGMETFYVIYRDITDRKESEKKLKVAMEKARESDRLKTAFLSNMSHEIRTPLNAIVGFSELMATNDLMHKEKKEYASLISHSSKLLVTLINDIIDVSKIESGQLKIIKKDTRIDELLQSVYDSFENHRLQINREDVKWIYEKGSEEYCVKTDPSRLRQILTNLLTNAFKFTESGYVKMGYKVEGGFIHFYVKDSGIGIARENIDRIFLRFQQADDSMTRKYGGTGLGLSISQSLVQLLGGTMKVRSEENKGSEFSFRIPDEPCTSYRSSGEKDDEPVTESSDTEAPQKPVILVVEDEDSNYMYIKAVLMPRGYQIIRAVKAQEALDLVKNRNDIGLVLMDIQLPDYSGYEATHKVKKLRPELPVIAQTAYAMGNEKEKCFEAGCDDYLAKPIDKDKLLGIIRQYLPG